MTWRTPLILGLIVGLVTGTKAIAQMETGKPGQVLGVKWGATPTPEPTPMPEPPPPPTPSPSPTPSPTPKPKPTVVPTPTAKPAPQFSSEQIYEFTNRYAGQYGVDANVIRHIALCESGFNPAAINNIYAGLFQFDTRTWISYRTQMGEDTDSDLRFHAEEAVQTAAFVMAAGKTHIWPNCAP